MILSDNNSAISDDTEDKNGTKITRKDSFAERVNKLDLVEMPPEDVKEKEIYRKNSFMKDVSLQDQTYNLGTAMAQSRTDRGVVQQDMAMFLGLNSQTYGRYERNEIRPTLQNFIHFCEILGVTPNEIFVHASPQLFGSDEDIALKRVALASRINSMDEETLDLFMNLLSAGKFSS